MTLVRIICVKGKSTDVSKNGDHANQWNFLNIPLLISSLFFYVSTLSLAFEKNSC